MNWLERLSNPRAILVLAVIAGLSCVLMLTLMLSWLRRPQQERETLLADFGQDIAAFCQNIDPASATITDSATLTDANNDGFQLLILRTDDSRPYKWQSKIPTELQATSPANLDVIICVVDYGQIVETCEYNPTGTETGQVQYSIERVLPFVDVLFYEPQSGKLVGKTTLQGGQPLLCPDEIPNNRSDDNLTHYLGREIPYEDFSAAVATFLAGGRQAE